jgi:hypothetical protein
LATGDISGLKNIVYGLGKSIVGGVQTDVNTSYLQNTLLPFGLAIGGIGYGYNSILGSKYAEIAKNARNSK